jgi:phosphoglycerate dehydrogenase-like enzyme
MRDARVGTQSLGFTVSPVLPVVRTTFAMKLLIVLHHRFDLWNAPAWFVERLQRDFPKIEITHLTNYDRIDQEIRDAEVVIAWSLRPEQVSKAKKLRWIHSPAAAVHQLMFPELTKGEVILTNAREVHGPIVAEHVIALIFALAKKVPEAVRLQTEHTWGQELIWQGSPRPREIASATLGLVGLGSTGREVAKRASALDMHVIGVRENPRKDKPPGIDICENLDSLLQQSDFVVLAVPITAASTKMMNAARIARMKPDAYLINVGRGPLVDEAALAGALRNHRIGGAALDVFEQEPLPADSPLWDLDNLLITPHTAGLTERLWERHYRLFSENLRRYRARQALLAVVDKDKGY